MSTQNAGFFQQRCRLFRKLSTIIIHGSGTVAFLLSPRPLVVYLQHKNSGLLSALQQIVASASVVHHISWPLGIPLALTFMTVVLCLMLIPDSLSHRSISCLSLPATCPPAMLKAEKSEFHINSIGFLGYIIESMQVKPVPEKNLSSGRSGWTKNNTSSSWVLLIFTTGFIYTHLPLPSPGSLRQIESSQISKGASFRPRPHSSRPITPLHCIGGRFWYCSRNTFTPVLNPRPKLYPCTCFSPHLPPAEHTYDTENHKLLAVKLALEECEHWLEGAEHPFIFWTDHKNFTYIHMSKSFHSRQAHWALFFGCFNLTPAWCPGPKNAKLDVLSHQFTSKKTPSNPETIITWDCEVETSKKQSQEAWLKLRCFGFWIYVRFLWSVQAINGCFAPFS